MDLPDDPPEIYQRLTVPHRVIVWPQVQDHLIDSNPHAAKALQEILKKGTTWLVNLELEKHSSPLRCASGAFALLGVQSGTTSASPITMQDAQKYTEAYFHSFNAYRPSLDYESFSRDIIGEVLRDGFVDGDPRSVLAFLVFALGQVAIGASRQPVSIQRGKPSGLQGDSIAEPPGTRMFNEARRRLGLVLNTGTLENVQILLLQATYYYANCRLVEFWSSTVAASMDCQVLIECRHLDPSTQTGDLTIRAYWACVLNEDLYRFDLDLPQTDIRTLQDEIQLPSFRYTQGSSEQKLAEVPFVQYHFLALIALRRLVVGVHEAVHQCMHLRLLRSSGWLLTNLTAPLTHAETSDDYRGPSVPVIAELGRQLDSWRALLPDAIQWRDSDRLRMGDETVVLTHEINSNTLAAELHTRFHYARHILYRPFVYKALHFPELLTADDVDYCVLAVQAACLWPVFFPPPKDRKRLVPHLFAWTNGSIGVLLIMRMIRVNETLRGVCEGRVSEREVDETVAVILDWLEGIRRFDAIAEWAWTVFEPMFKGTDEVTDEVDS
jgi:hypothetical protein